MIYLAVDPGATTGWAAHMPRPLAEPFSSGEDSFLDFLDRAWVWFGWYEEPATIIVERFVITSGTVRKSRGDENWSMESIGALRWMARKHGHTFELQSASDAMKFSQDERLKQIGWFTPGRGHANDAARHLLLALARHEPTLLQDLLII